MGRQGMDGVGEMFGDVDGELDGEIVGEPAGDVDGIAVGLHVTSQPVFPQSAQMIALWQEERRGDVGPTTMECKTKAGNDEPPVDRWVPGQTAGLDRWVPDRQQGESDELSHRI